MSQSPTNYPGAEYNVTPPTLYDRQTSVLQSDVNGKLLVSLGSGTITTTPGLYEYVPVGYSKLDVTTSTAVGFSTGSGGLPAGVKYATIAIVGGSVMIRDDGVDPTATEGFPLPGGASLDLPTYYPYQSNNFSAAKFISISAPSTLYILFYQ